MNQHTLAQAFDLEGKGLHTGEIVQLTVLPAETDSGITFIHTDANTEIKCLVTNITNTVRNTSIESDGVVIHTIEHIISALWCLGVDNASIRINGSEIPILDGSAKPFAEQIIKAGIVEQDKERKYFESKEILRFEDEETGSSFEYFPQEDFEVDVRLDYDFAAIGHQYATYTEDVDYIKDISPCRTFVLLSELEKLADAGYIKGGDLDNAVIFANKKMSNEDLAELSAKLGHDPMPYDNLGPLNTELFFSNEPARHKLLDALGDFALLGMRIKGKIVAHKPGHLANARFTQFLLDSHKSIQKRAHIPTYDPTKEPLKTTMDIQEMLPHRYPFLLVDKIIELGENHIVGVKNVTFNESFFQGHFPNNPVMPGVLIVEALAQTGGVLALSKTEDPGNWDTYFIKMDNTKFRNKVLPGDTLLLKMELLRPIRRGICNMKATAYVGDKLVTEGELTAQIINRTKL